MLPQLERYAGVAINWNMFGTSGVRRKPARATSLETFVQCENQVNAHLKVLVQVDRVASMWIHSATPVAGDPYCIVNLLGLPAGVAFAPEITADADATLRLNHYFTRDEQFMLDHKVASHIRAGFPDSETIIRETNARFSARRSDGAIERFAPELRRLLESPIVNKISSYAASVRQRGGKPLPITASTALPLLDWSWYATRYPDLGAAGVTSRADLEQHWLNHGKREGRYPNVVCEVARRDGTFDWFAYSRSVWGTGVVPSLYAAAHHRLQCIGASSVVVNNVRAELRARRLDQAKARSNKTTTTPTTATRSAVAAARTPRTSALSSAAAARAPTTPKTANNVVDKRRIASPLKS